MQIPGFTEPEELAWLHTQAERFRSVIEIGCWQGRSTSALASGCRGLVTTVDHFLGSAGELEAAHAEARARDIRRDLDFMLAGWPNVRVLALESRVAARLVNDRSADMVFIDGDHDYAAVLTDLLLWRPKATRLLCGHDVDWPGVRDALTVYGLPWQYGPGTLWYADLIGGC